MHNVEFHVIAEEPDAVVEELSVWLADLWSVEPVRSTREVRHRSDGLAVIAVILALPSAVESTVNLWNSESGRKRLSGFIEWARSKFVGNTQGFAVSSDGIVKNLSLTSEEEWIDLFWGDPENFEQR